MTEKLKNYSYTKGGKYEKNKNIFFIEFTVFLMLLPSLSHAQLTGIKYIGGTSPDYTTIESAINDLNSQGVGTGGVNFPDSRWNLH